MDWKEYAYGERKTSNQEPPINNPDDKRIRRKAQPTKHTDLQGYITAISKVSPKENSGWNRIEVTGELATGTDPEIIGKPSKTHTDKLRARLLDDNAKEGGQGYGQRD